MLITKGKQATGGTGPALADWHLDSTGIFVAPNTKLTRSAAELLKEGRVGRIRHKSYGVGISASAVASWSWDGRAHINGRSMISEDGGFTP